MTSVAIRDQTPIPPPPYHRALAHALHLDALTLLNYLHWLSLCRVAVQIAQRRRSSQRCRETACSRLASLVACRARDWPGLCSWCNRFVVFTWRRDMRGTLTNRSLTNALAVLTAAAIIVLNGRRTCRTFGGETNRLLH